MQDLLGVRRRMRFLAECKDECGWCSYSVRESHGNQEEVQHLESAPTSQRSRTDDEKNAAGELQAEDGGLSAFA